MSLGFEQMNWLNGKRAIWQCKQFDYASCALTSFLARLMSLQRITDFSFDKARKR
ncbi:hypothetical protein M979_2760 [Buttiauxella noackiae ATCC 51607]|jgi:hypothetical protein|uniref:Uncharacterized protein n=1 Tax=Buttiauxella noackiae ATCC 51607 TaxID=1354255 RepID=A0A1B7HL42_9ENTR|nr:hypothetical protein M979_2760 [Buttiauxella noackiae ATCC 51607]